MRELKQDWRDIFGGFRVAFDVWKLLLGFLGIVVTFLVVWGLRTLLYHGYEWTIPIIIGGVVLVGLVIKVALSETGLGTTKVIGLILLALALAGGVILCLYTDTGKAWCYTGGVAFFLLTIWAFFGGAITRIAAVEIASDDRVGFGEATRYACKKYGSYLGATLLPAIAVIFLALCCALFGFIFQWPIADIAITVFFFLVPLAGFLMFLIGLGGMVGWPLMYPAVSAEGNDSFDAISRAYSYVFGRPWRYIFYNIMGLLYGIGCGFFVTFFTKHMLTWSLASLNYGSGNDYFDGNILPRVKTLLIPVNDIVREYVQSIGNWIGSVDITGYVFNSYRGAVMHLGLLQQYSPDNLTLTTTQSVVAVIITIFIYFIVGLLASYILSLFFSIQTTIYLLLRKAVDGADMTEVYKEEEEEDYLSVTPEAPLAAGTVEEPKVEPPAPGQPPPAPEEEKPSKGPGKGK
jgi:hypothetical protein